MVFNVKPAAFTDLSPCRVNPPTAPLFRTSAELSVVPDEADAVVLEFCDIEKAVELKSLGIPEGQEKFLLSWGDAKALCYAILRATASRGDIVSAKCLRYIDEEIKRGTSSQS